ncbi:MAG TPA: hypothetical protein VN317_07305 [Candidatus Methanoperedens sp.]|nr:hypothetical protein [Candidatus Methanoperedens sp.]
MWIVQNILVPVTQFITDARERCEEIGQWIDEQVSQPVERWISQQEERCRALPWWNPLRWFCEIVTIVVKVVEWVVVTVTKWVVTIVCQIVTTVIGIIVTLVLRVLSWLVTFLVCLFTDPLEALRSLRDLWMILVETVEDVFELAETLLADVIGILDDVNRLLDSVSSSAGWIGVVLGPVKGVKDLAHNLVEDLRDLVGAIRDVVTGILGLNLCKIARGGTDLATVAGRVLLDTGLAPVAALAGPGGAAVAGGARVVGAAVAGTRDAVDMLRLEEVITAAVSGAFGAGSERAVRSLRRVGIGAGTMGLPFRADARRLFLASRSTTLNPGDLHRARIINLHALAGHFSDCGGTINEPEGEVVYSGTDLKVSYADLDAYLSDGPAAAPEFQVFPISRAKFWMHLREARRKAKTIGVLLNWGTIGDLQAISPQEVPLNALERGQRDQQGNTPGDTSQVDLFRRMGRTGGNDDLAILPVVSHFHYVLGERVVNGVTRFNEGFGLTSWFRPGTTWRCFGTVAPARGPSGVTYRNRTPDWVFRWVLVHEMGHYWGLDHVNRQCGDRGLDEIMYAPSTGIGLTGSAVYEYLLGGGEARFTLDDARSVWDYITTDGAMSLLP